MAVLWTAMSDCDKPDVTCCWWIGWQTTFPSVAQLFCSLTLTHTCILPSFPNYFHGITVQIPSPRFWFQIRDASQFSASVLTFSLQLQGLYCFFLPFFWSFIKGCFKCRTCSHPRLLPGTCTLMSLSPREPKPLRFAKLNYLTHLNPNELKICMDPQITWQALLSEACLPGVVPA